MSTFYLMQLPWSYKCIFFTDRWDLSTCIYSVLLIHILIKLEKMSKLDYVCVITRLCICNDYQTITLTHLTSDSYCFTLKEIFCLSNFINDWTLRLYLKFWRTFIMFLYWCYLHIVVASICWWCLKCTSRFLLFNTNCTKVFTVLTTDQLNRILHSDRCGSRIFKRVPFARKLCDVGVIHVKSLHKG